MATDQETVDANSTLGLKRNMLSRYAKKWHLRENYKMTQQERDALLDELYGVLALRTPEAWEKQDIWRYLDSLPNCWYVKPMTFGYGKSGVPDILACLDGKFVSIEVKRHGKGATATQKRRMAEVSAAGGTAFWGTADKVIAELTAWIKTQNAEHLYIPKIRFCDDK